MTRRKVIVQEYRWAKCPVLGCSKRYDPTIEKKVKGMAQHIAMSRDENHKRWMEEHGLSVSYETNEDVERIKEKVLEIIG